jgi:hypothetical protein
VEMANAVNWLTTSMPTKHARLPVKKLLVLCLCALVVSTLPVMARAQSSGAQPKSTELDAILFVQSLRTTDGRDGIHLVWIPQPLQRLCLGKTSQQCANMDYCVRTTNPDVSQCHNLGIPLSRLPKYPRDMIPRRQLSVVLLALSPDKFPKLQEFYHRAPKASLEHLSLSTRVKARVRFTRKPDDDDFDVLDVVAVAPF